MRYGAIYIAHNPKDGESVFKVGKTERVVEERMKELTSSTSNIGEYSAISYFIVAGVDEAEKACHKRLSRYRVQSNREFFDIPFKRLIPIVREVLKPFTVGDYFPKLENEDLDKNIAPSNPKEQLLEIRKNKKSKEKFHC